jgi:YegS/Rv2252/BmrU family lipid kinase
MKLVFILNRKSKKRVWLYHYVEEFRKFHLFEQVEVWDTRHVGHAISLAEKAEHEGFNFVIAAGGDGTINEVVNGLLKASQGNLPNAKFGFIAAGSGNDFSKTIPSIATPEDLREIIRRERPQRVDVGRVVCVDREAHRVTRYFINVLDAGIGGMVAQKVNASKKRLGTGIAFFGAIFSSFLTFKSSEMEIQIGDQTLQRKVRTIVVGNGKAFGNGLYIAPDAKPADGKFSVVIIGDVSTMDYLKHLKKIKKGEFLQHPQVEYIKANALLFRPVEAAFPIEVDGEYCGYAPAEVSMIPGGLEIINPF